MDLRRHIGAVPDFPKPGIMFRDITPLLLEPAAFEHVVREFEARFSGAFDVIGAVESRGFLLGAPLALRTGTRLALVRKSGRLPRETVSRDYSLEYGNATLEMHREDVRRGDRVLLVDDLIATGGTLLASVGLVRELGATVAGIASVIDLPDLGGSKALRQAGVETLALTQFGGA